jgi:hypothetical protein
MMDTKFAPLDGAIQQDGACTALDRIAVYHASCPMTGPGDHNADSPAWWERHRAEVDALIERVGEASGGCWVAFDLGTAEEEHDRPTTGFSLLVHEPGPLAATAIGEVLEAHANEVTWDAASGDPSGEWSLGEAVAVDVDVPKVGPASNVAELTAQRAKRHDAIDDLRESRNCEDRVLSEGDEGWIAANEDIIRRLTDEIERKSAALGGTV